MPCQNDVIHINTFQLPRCRLSLRTTNSKRSMPTSTGWVGVCVHVYMCVCVMTTTCAKKSGWQVPIQIGGPPVSHANRQNAALISGYSEKNTMLTFVTIRRLPNLLCPSSHNASFQFAQHPQRKSLKCSLPAKHNAIE